MASFYIFVGSVFSETKNKENAFKHFDLVKMSNQNV